MSRFKNAGFHTKAPWIAALLIVIAFFMVNGVLAYRSTHIMALNASNITNTLNILNLIEQMKGHLFRAESAQRGYIITTRDIYLIPYNDSVDKLQNLLTTLGETSTEHQIQKERFKLIHKLVFDKLLDMSQSIEMIKDNQTSAARGLVATDRGSDLSLRILELIQEMEIDEHVRFNEHRLSANENHQLLAWILLIVNGVGLILALATFYVTFRYSSRLNSLNAEIEQANAELEEKVQMRTDTLKHYAEELERSNRELEDFAFVASHDLQEPLRKIRAFGDRLSKKFAPELDEQGQDYIQRMHSASERMSRLIEDLLTFSRVTSRQRELEPVDLNQVIEELLENLEIAISARDARIDIDKLPVIDGDTSQLRQMFANLLSNSLKFTAPEKTPHIKITYHLMTPNPEDENEKTARIDVQDNGIGFEEQYKDRIFNLFQRLHGRDEYTGTGIGLAICRKIVERHGGSIEVKSEPGAGTCFSIFLPINQNTVHQFEANEDAV